MRFLQFLTMLAAAFVFAACGGGSPAGTSRPGGASAPAASVATAAVTCGGSGGQAVSIKNTAYDPTSSTVSTGATVTWTNNDSFAHTVSFDGGPDCGNVAGGATVSATFSQAGTYAYHCTIHSNMKAAVTVS